MLSSRPYLIEAIFEWILDNGQTPFLMIDTTVEGVMVPEKHIVDDEIVLNLKPAAITHFVMNKEYIQFKARFSGKIEEIYAPLKSVKALYSKEDMSGIGFTPEGQPYFAGDVTGEDHLLNDDESGDDSDGGSSSSDAPSHLRLV